jgi:hypothetical protein
MREHDLINLFEESVQIMILIVSEKDDAHIPMVLPKLVARGASYLWLNVSSFPTQTQIAIEYGKGGLSRNALWYEGQRYDLSTVSAVWHRRQRRVQVTESVKEQNHRDYVERASNDALQGMWAVTGGRWLPALPNVDLAAGNKLYHAKVAAQLGFELPETLVTNSPHDFLDFWSRSCGPIISKSAPFRGLERDGERYHLLTHLVHRRHALNADLVRYSPVIFQHYVPKRVELRVTVVGQQLFAAEIDSQTSRSTRHDWRHYDDPNVQYRVHTLPAELASRCLRLVESLGLSYGAIDLIQTPEGNYVFLEINPNGQWAWIEEMTGLPISEAIADWLASSRDSDQRI